MNFFQSLSFVTARKYLTMTILESFQILIPDDITLKKFNQITNPILKQIIKNDDELEKILQIRD